jgi:hypothetical protein
MVKGWYQHHHKSKCDKSAYEVFAEKLKKSGTPLALSMVYPSCHICGPRGRFFKCVILLWRDPVQGYPTNSVPWMFFRSQLWGSCIPTNCIQGDSSFYTWYRVPRIQILLPLHHIRTGIGQSKEARKTFSCLDTSFFPKNIDGYSFSIYPEKGALTSVTSCNR